MIFKQRVKKLSKTFRSVYKSRDSPEQDIIVFNIPVIIAKKNKINAQGLKKILAALLKTCLSTVNFLQWKK